MGAESSQELLLEDPFLQNETSEQYTRDFSVDINGKPVLRNKTGNWKACAFILGHECGERLAYYGVAANLVSYLVGKLHKPNVSAARTVSTWHGTCYLTPLVGAFFGDAYWGRYWTIAAFSTFYFIGLCVLTICASVPALKPVECIGSICPSATPAQYAIFLFGLYLVALGSGGIKPCVSSFGADQFDDTDPKEREAKGSFFNWFFLSIQMGTFLSTSFLVWIQENVGWGIGFGMATLFISLAVASFFLGTPLYRFQNPGGSPLTRLCQVLVASFRKWKSKVPQDHLLLHETSHEHSVIEGSRKLEHTDGLRWLDKAAVVSDAEKRSMDFLNPWSLCTVTQVEELKILIRMFPIWSTSVFYNVVYSQVTTTFVEQGKAMDRTVGSLTIPAASLGIFFAASNIFWVLAYDKLLIPVARRFTSHKRGFSELQRIGIGLFICVLSMMVAAIVEIRRLQEIEIPLKVFWQMPQYFLVAAAEAFVYVGDLEFFYNESPDAMRSLCGALALLTVAGGCYLNSLILTIVNTLTTTTGDGDGGWIPNDLNRGGHLDYFFWLLAGLCFLNFLIYVPLSIQYKPKKVS